MTPSQRKTVWLLERLVQDAAGGERATTSVSKPDAHHDVEVSLHVGHRRIGLVKITPVGRPCWPEEVRER